jgi:uncharacterized protein
MTTTEQSQVPVVSYLVLDRDDPHLVAWRCSSCGALFLDRRIACAACAGDELTRHRLADRGTVRAFTVVYRSPTKAPTPFVAAIVDLDGGGVIKSHLIGVLPDPAAVRPGMRVRLTTYPVGVDTEGTEAIGFAFAPDDTESSIPATKESSVE